MGRKNAVKQGCSFLECRWLKEDCIWRDYEFSTKILPVKDFVKLPLVQKGLKDQNFVSVLGCNKIDLKNGRIITYIPNFHSTYFNRNALDHEKAELRIFCKLTCFLTSLRPELKVDAGLLGRIAHILNPIRAPRLASEFYENISGLRENLLNVAKGKTKKQIEEIKVFSQQIIDLEDYRRFFTEEVDKRVSEIYDLQNRIDMIDTAMFHKKKKDKNFRKRKEVLNKWLAMER